MTLCSGVCMRSLPTTWTGDAARIHAKPDFPKLLRSEWRKVPPEVGHTGDPAGVTIYFKFHQHSSPPALPHPSNNYTCYTA